MNLLELTDEKEEWSPARVTENNDVVERLLTSSAT